MALKNSYNINNTAILNLVCPDKKGIVAGITNFIAANNGNIINLDQYTDPVHKQFFMRLEWDIHDFKLAGPQIEKNLQKFGKIKVYFSENRLAMAIFVSKYDHCLYDLLLRQRTGEINCTIPLIISNHPDLAYVAKAFGIDFYCVPTDEKKQLALLKKYKIDFVALARYMQVLSPQFIKEYPDKIINIHHSFLPAFKGAKPYHQAYEKGVKVIGATSHFVTPDLDQGPIIQQAVSAISHRDTVDDLIVKGRDLERKVLAEAIRLYNPAPPLRLRESDNHPLTPLNTCNFYHLLTISYRNYMLQKLTATADFIKDLPVWQQLMCYPEKIKLLSETQFEYEMITLPDTLVEKTVEELKTMVFNIFETRFDSATTEKLKEMLNLVQAAHDKTGAKRHSGKPYFQHVLIATLLAWTYSHAFLEKDEFNEKELFIVMIHHDAFEDTKIYSPNKGKQFEIFMRMYGEDLGVEVGYLTRTRTKINKDFSKFKERQDETYFSAFKQDTCQRKTTYLEISRSFE